MSLCAMSGCWWELGWSFLRVWGVFEMTKWNGRWRERDEDYIWHELARLWDGLSMVRWFLRIALGNGAGFNIIVYCGMVRRLAHWSPNGVALKITAFAE
jgi:hypothetical protein